MGNCKQVSLDVALWCPCRVAALIYAHLLWKVLLVNLSFHVEDYFQQLCLGQLSREYYGSENILACQPSAQE